MIKKTGNSPSQPSVGINLANTLIFYFWSENCETTNSCCLNSTPHPGFVVLHYCSPQTSTLGKKKSSRTRVLDVCENLVCDFTIWSRDTEGGRGWERRCMCWWDPGSPCRDKSQHCAYRIDKWKYTASLKWNTLCQSPEVVKLPWRINSLRTC